MSDRGNFDAMLLSTNVIQELQDYEASGRMKKQFPDLQAIVGFGGGDTGHKDLWGHTCQVVAQTIPSILVRWAALFHDVGKPRCYSRVGGEIKFVGHEMVSARLFCQASRETEFFTREEEDTIWFLIRNLGHIEEYDSEWSDSAVRRLYTLAEKHFEDLVALARADITTKHMNLRKAYHARMHELKTRAYEIAKQDAIPNPLVKGLGEVLMQEFNIPPGRELGALMKKLTAAVESGELARQAEPDVVVAFARTQKWQ